MNSEEFRERFFPKSDWNNWRWQLSNRLTKQADFERIFTLSKDETAAFTEKENSFKASVTPYIASLINKSPLRKCHIPTTAEFIKKPWETSDPLGEDKHLKTPVIIHRYRDRVLFLTTDFCPAHCRFCTRSRMVGRNNLSGSKSRWKEGLDYIKAHTEIRDVLVSGGEPLSFETEKLEWLLKEIRSIKHIRFLRIGTRAPFAIPMRITANLVEMLKKYRPWISVHSTHPDEFTPESTEACLRLADAGIPLGSQTVLLKGVNDTPETMMELMHGLLERQIKPYYLFHCEQTAGMSHFRTSIDKGREIILHLRKHTTGYAVPDYVMDVPGCGGKIPLSPEYDSVEKRLLSIVPY